MAQAHNQRNQTYPERSRTQYSATNDTGASAHMKVNAPVVAYPTWCKQASKCLEHSSEIWASLSNVVQYGLFTIHARAHLRPGSTERQIGLLIGASISPYTFELLNAYFVYEE